MKKALSLAIVFTMLVSTAVYASFSPVKEYNENVFSDISQSDWFYEGVSGAYSYGFTEGSGEGKYSPYGLVSIAEVITFASRLNMIYSQTEQSFEEGEKWYTPWVEYAEQHGIIEEKEFSGKYEKAATRGQVAYILGNSLPFAEFENINMSITQVADMSNTDNYYNEVIMLYRAGVLTGKDAMGNFAPTENITRGEMATVIYRIANKEARLSVTINTVNEESKVYNAEEISEMASNSVFLIGVYNSEDELFATGSGFFIDSDGTAVTNYHVVEDAASAVILTPDGETYDVELLLGCDSEKDIAVIKVQGENFSCVKLGDSDLVRNGQEIFCIGSPQGLDNTISSGLVSNASREVDGRNYIQISAPISSGSSGGAVFNNKSEVIGISSAGFTEGQNLNLAIPINEVSTIERNVNKTLAQYFGKQQNESNKTENGSDIYYPGTSLLRYEYVTNRRPFEESEDDGMTICAYNYVPFEFQLYLRVLGQQGWALVSNKRDGTLIMMGIARGDEVAIVAYDLTEYTVLIAYK